MTSKKTTLFVPMVHLSKGLEDKGAPERLFPDHRPAKI
jgi:hypothetical protein